MTMSKQHVYMLVLSVVAALVPAAFGQITGPTGDGVLNAPYRGTITSLREACMDMPYGEVMNHTEPFTSLGTITSAYLRIWFEPNPAGQVWDRSVLRLYRGFDASGTNPEINLDGCTSSSTAYIISSPGWPGGFERLSFKAIGTKTLAVQTYTIKFAYDLNGLPTTVPLTVKVAPVTGSFLNLPGESEAFHYGTPILTVAVGKAKLVVPIGCKLDWIGAAFIDKDEYLGPCTIGTNDVVLPGAAESVFVPRGGTDADSQFRTASSTYGPNKLTYGTPWAGYLIGFWQSDEPGQQGIYGPDGTRYQSLTTTGNGMRRFDRIRPLGIDSAEPPTHAATLKYTYDGNSRVTKIEDGAGNSITISRNVADQVTISTSDSPTRTWVIKATNGWITAVEPGTGIGKRYYSHDNSTGRVTQVRLNPTVDQEVLYQFDYGTDGDLLREWRYIEGQGLIKAVEHLVASDNPNNRERREFVDATNYRKTYLTFDTVANRLANRLASVKTYAGLNGTGTEYTTTYTHDTGNRQGNMVITKMALPDTSYIDHEYDYEVDQGFWRSYGFRTKSTHKKGSNSFVTYDVEYDFYYPRSSPDVLYYCPRIVKQRDGRGTVSATSYEYELGNEDPNGDGLVGQVGNQLRWKTGPTINLGTSGQRIPKVEYIYGATAGDLAHTYRMLAAERTYYTGSAYRETTFTYDSLLRLKTQTSYPGGGNPNSLTQYDYVDAQPTQDRTVIDPEGYYTQTTFDNDGRVRFIKRYLAPNGMAGAFYQTENQYDSNGRLQYQIIDNKDQSGTALTQATITTQFAYDRLGRLTTKTVDPGSTGHVNQETHFTYTWQNEVENQYDTSGRGAHKTYDGRGMLSTETVLDEGQVLDPYLITSYTYHPSSGYPEYIIKPTGVQTQKIYDDFGRIWKEVRIPVSGSGSSNITTTYEYNNASDITRTYVDEGTTHLSDSTSLYDEGRFNYESRQRLTFGVDGTNDPVTQRKFDWAGNVTEERSLGDSHVIAGIDPTTQAATNDRVGKTTYDGASRVQMVQDSQNGQTVYQRDGRGNVTSQTVSLTTSSTAVTDTLYDALSRPIRITDPQDQYTNRHYRQRGYDSRGNLLRETAFTSAGMPLLTTVYSYNAIGCRTQEAVLKNAGSAATTGNISTDRVVDTGYDADGRLRTKTQYNSGTTGSLITQTDYDPQGRVSDVLDPSGAITSDVYEPNGRLESRTIGDGIPRFVRFTFGYDGHDRVTSQTEGGLVTSFTYDGLDRQITTTNPKGTVTKTEFDLVGRRNRLTEDFGGDKQRATEFTYNRLGQMIAQAAPDPVTGQPLTAHPTNFRCDTLGRTKRIVYPDSNDNPEESAPVAGTYDGIFMDYDRAGRMTSRTDQRGSATAMTYDARGLLLTKITGTPPTAVQETFDYDALGRTLLADRGTAGSPTATSHATLAYNALPAGTNDLGDLLAETQAIQGSTGRPLAHAYDQGGFRTGLSYPSGISLTYTPTLFNQVGEIKLNGTTLATYAYYTRLLDNRRITTNSGTPTVYKTVYGYDHAHHRLDQVDNTLQINNAPPSVIASYSIPRDDNGNVQSQTATGMAGFAGDNRTYTVDRLDQLTDTYFASSGKHETSTLDRVGNRQSFTNLAGQVMVYTLATDPAGWANQYGTIGGWNVTYDAAGNLATDEVGRHYDYDEQNRLVGIRASDGTTQLASYAYDALGRRIVATIGETTTRYYYDGQTAIEEYHWDTGTASETRSRYHVNGGQYIDERVASYDDATAAFSYYLLNDNFSVAGTGNADGSVIQALGYTALGDFSGLGYLPDDFNCDGQVDQADFDFFATAGAGPAEPPAGGNGAAADLNGDGHVDLKDFLQFQQDFHSSSRPGLKAGTFAMHGRPVDVIPDPIAKTPLLLADFRARPYDVKHGRWLQRDPMGYVDGTNLYEAFRSNAGRFTDATGLDSIEADGPWLVYKGSGFQWPFARDIGENLVLIDNPWWPYAFIMKRDFVIGEFQRSSLWLGIAGSKFDSMYQIMSHATKIASDAGAPSYVLAVFDKRAKTLGWKDPGSVVWGERTQELHESAQSAKVQQLREAGALTQVAFTVTAGALLGPTGAGGAAVEIAATAADVASGKQSVGSGAMAITVTAAGILLHSRLGGVDDAVPGAGGVLEPRVRVGTGGRIESAFAKIEPQHLLGGTATTPGARALVRRVGEATDDAGHLIGRALGGRGGATSGNIVPQAPSINRGDFRQFEAMIAQRVGAGDQVFVRVVPHYQGNDLRPYEILYQARINGVTTSRVFPNR